MQTHILWSIRTSIQRIYCTDSENIVHVFVPFSRVFDLKSRVFGLLSSVFTLKSRNFGSTFSVFGLKLRKFGQLLDVFGLISRDLN